jgi:hypothetical protein
VNQKLFIAKVEQITRGKTNFCDRLLIFSIGFFLISGNCLTFKLPLVGAIKISEFFLIFSFVFIVLQSKFRQYIYKTGNFFGSFLYFFVWLILATLTCIPSSIKNNYSFTELVVGIMYSIRLLFYLFSSIVFSKYLNYRFYGKEFLAKIVCFSFLIVCFIGFFQLIFYPEALDFYDVFYRIGVYYPNPDPHINRLVSTYFDPNYLSCCLLIPLALSFTLITKNNHIFLFFPIVFIVTILFTKSRSGFLGLTIMLGLFFPSSIVL